MRGKYSPTVSAAYQKDQDWWNKYAYAGKSGDEFVQYDPEGYDSYGYNKDDIDRAGNAEWEYYESDDWGENWQYSQALNDWGFDGTKPVQV